MPNQRTIARAAGVNQATVSLALRNSPLIAPATREHVFEVAKRLGYRPNSYVSSLMAHIRSGRRPPERGCIALLRNNVAKNDDSASLLSGRESYEMQLRGMAHRARELGFTTELFEVPADEVIVPRLNRILKARGIAGLVFAAPNAKRVDFSGFTYARYSMATIAFSWPDLALDRVTAHHRKNVQIAYECLRLRGCRRIGMCLPEDALRGVDFGWKAGHLLEFDDTEKACRIPLFVGKPGCTPLAPFRRWMARWKPDAIVCLIGQETVWLDELGIKVPEQTILACLNRLPNSPFPGIDENHDAVGAMTIDMVVSRILCNERGFPIHPKLVMINGTWVEA